MTGTFAAIGFVVTIVVVILIHEAGHFLMARKFDIKVEEYFLGFGPKLWSTRSGETEYGVKAIPLGGYVKIAGMNPFLEPLEEDLPRTYGAKPIWQRSLVILAGPVTHFALAFVVLVLYLGVVGQPSRYSAAITEVQSQLNGHTSPAAAAGLRPGDVVVSVNGHPADVDNFIGFTRADTDGTPLVLVVRRDGEEVTVSATPEMATLEGQTRPFLGISLSPGAVLSRDKSGFFGSFKDAGVVFWSGVTQVFDSFARVFGPEGIGRLFRLVFGHAQRSTGDAVSMVGAARIASQAADAGQFDAFVALFVSINLFVGLLNLVPLPPFDGGHLATLAIEKLRHGQKVDMRRMIPVTAVVAALLITFMVAVVYLDFVKPVPNLFP